MSYPPNQPFFDPDGETQPTPLHDPNGVTQPSLPPQPPQPQATPPPYYPPPWKTSPDDYLGQYQPVRKRPRRRRSIRLPFKGGCCVAVGAVIGVFLCLAIAFVAAAFILSPGKTNILVLGID